MPDFNINIKKMNPRAVIPAVAWLQQCYDAERSRWENIPSILDCEPDR